jgi:hypothetical protein
MTDRGSDGREWAVTGKKDGVQTNIRTSDADPLFCSISVILFLFMFAALTEIHLPEWGET